METFKKYLPYIILAILGYLIIKKISQSSQGNYTAKLTTVSQQNVSPTSGDPLLPFRASAFQQLVNAGNVQSQAETAKGAQAIQAQAQLLNAEAMRRNYDLQTYQAGNTFQQYLANLSNQLSLGMRGYQAQENIAKAQSDANIELSKYLADTRLIGQNSTNANQQYALDLYYQQRENDRQNQQAAIDNVLRNQRTNTIIGSIGTALGGLFNSGIFGGSSNSDPFRTPPFYFGDSFSGGYSGGDYNPFDTGFGGFGYYF